MIIKLKLATNQVIDFEILSDEMLISDIKVQIADKLNLPLDQIRVVTYNGRVFAPDHAEISTMGLNENDVVFVTSQTPNTTTRTAPRQNTTTTRLSPEMLSALNNPITEYILLYVIIRMLFSNPEFMETMMRSDPRIERMAEQHPESTIPTSY
jgi:hypothetical protein